MKLECVSLFPRRGRANKLYPPMLRIKLPYFGTLQVVVRTPQPDALLLYGPYPVSNKGGS